MQTVSFDVGQFNLNLAKLENLHAGKIARALDKIGDFVSGEAKDRAPLKEGVLTMSIESDVQGNAVVVRVPANSPAAEYAVPMHESEYNLGDKSLKKQGKWGVEVGRKYITRAIDDNVDKIRGIAIDELHL